MMRYRFALLLAASTVLPAVAQAQYFGQNKVVYGRFNFEIIRTQHFDVYYYGRERAAAMDAARMSERAYARLSRILNHEWRERKPLILYASLSDFAQTNAISGELGEGTGGVTEFFKHRMILPFTGSYADFEHVLQHEMVHAFQYDVFSRGHPGGGISALQNINPSLWFMEGMAEYLSLGPIDAHTAMWVRDAAVEGPFPSIERMTFDPSVFPYRFGHALFAYIGQKWGDETIGAILQGTMTGGIERAFQRVLGVSLEELSDEWRDAVRATYLPQVLDNLPARRFARVALNMKKSQGGYHVSPQLSPDGTRIAYLSERNFFFVDLWLADAETGRVLRRLVRSSLDANYESLRFVYSSGGWSPDGRQYVFAAKRGGEDMINILDVERGNVDRFSVGVNGVTNPSFSPDGRRVVFTGLDGGISDLYIVDADGQNQRRLTNDRYADLLPQWSPDGNTLAFTTDRGPDTDFDALRYGNFRIALYHLDGDSVQMLPWMDDGKNTNPVWSPDGRTLAFLSDRSGISNIYLYDFAAADVFQITHVLTGVTGITDLSPALSWARQADRLAFTTFENGEYNVYTVDNPRSMKRDPYRVDPVSAVALANAAAQPLRVDAIAGRGLRRPDAAALAAAAAARPGMNPAVAGTPAAPQTPRDTAAPGTPPASSVYRSGGRTRPSDQTGAAVADSTPAPVNVAALLDSAALSLPDTSEFMHLPYRVRFTPDFVGRPSIGYQRDNFGRGFFGGTALALSDILGNRSIIFSAAVNGRISEAQLFGAYLNQTRRLNWAVGASQEPIFFYGQSTYDPDVDGAGTQALNQQLRRIVFREMFLQTAYPFNRFRRLEIGTRLVNISQATLNQVTYYDQFGNFIGFTDSLSNEGNVAFLQPNIALVYDNSLFGYTSPFYGQRYRFSISPSVPLGRSGWSYTEAAADYRRYDMLFAPFFTLSSRLLFLGRYGRDGNQFPIYIGSPDLVRGYTYGSFVDSECSPGGVSSQTGCPELDQLIGSRIAVANIEFRFPLIRYLALGILPVGLPPIEGALFYDAGMAWNQGSDLRWSRTPGASLDIIRSPVASYGAGIRMNLFGFAILRLDYAIPQQRPAKGGYWTVSLGPPF